MVPEAYKGKETEKMTEEKRDRKENMEQ